MPQSHIQNTGWPPGFCPGLPARETVELLDGHTEPAAGQVVIIEDNPDGRETLRMLLECVGYRVEAAADGIQGLEEVLRCHPDVAVVDIGLPGLDGYQVARRVRAVLGDEVALIAVSGYGRPEDRQRAIQSGFDAHMVKPVDPSELLDLLAELPHAKREGRPGTDDDIHGTNGMGHA